jgi:hypothetical protein
MWCRIRGMRSSVARLRQVWGRQLSAAVARSLTRWQHDTLDFRRFLHSAARCLLDDPPARFSSLNTIGSEVIGFLQRRIPGSSRGSSGDFVEQSDQQDSALRDMPFATEARDGARRHGCRGSRGRTWTPTLTFVNLIYPLHRRC